jgi:hypothetical protein
VLLRAFERRGFEMKRNSLTVKGESFNFTIIEKVTKEAFAESSRKSYFKWYKPEYVYSSNGILLLGQRH